MAYYPAQDTKIVTAKTEDAMKAAVAAAMADGYFPVSDTAVWDAKLVAPTEAYRQTMVKYQNTDAQFITAMYDAFKPALDDIRAHLASIDTKLDTANSRLASIVSNTDRITYSANTNQSESAIYSGVIAPSDVTLGIDDDGNPIKAATS